MRYVDCGKEPASLRRLQESGNQEWDPQVEYSDLIQGLGQPFEFFCAYCELPCSGGRGRGNNPTRGTIDHFRPRHYFPALTFAWENLMYVCERCNRAKGDSFPGKTDLSDLAINLLRYEAELHGKQFIDLSETDGYVNPRDPAERAETFFVFDDDGQILPSDDLDGRNWSKARRTISDFDLNPVGGSVDLCRRRKAAWEYVKSAALLLSSVGTRRAERLNSLLKQPRPGFPSFVAWKLSKI